MGSTRAGSEVMSDSQSDYTGRGSSLGSSREDLHELAIALGLPSIDCLSQDRFKVDRKRLEMLIFGNENAPNAAAQFFDNIMQETKTHVTWPSRLKLGAKSKKDPHIRVVGRPSDVKLAREKILATLDTRASRVNMKIDVSYTDHSHIIGKGGFTIRRVMEETGCHIHFPDSNRSNPKEKSNQVSIAGEVAGVEKARSRVRELTPLIFCFELPILGALALSPDPSTPYIKSLQDQYNVQVTFRTRQKLNSTLVLVKGCEWEVSRVKEATLLLISYMCDSLAGQVLVHMMVEISPQHHAIVLGRNNENLKGIKQRTNTQIVFQDANDPNIPSLKKSNVVITGSIHNVYLARQQLIGSLPVVLMFDVPENFITVDTELNSQIMNKYDILITTRHKPKQNILSFILKGIERNVGNLYEARRQLIAPTENHVDVNIPSLYLIPNSGPVFNNAWKMNSEPLIYPNLPSPPVIPVLGRPEPAWHPVMQFQLLPHIPYHQSILSPHAMHFDRLPQTQFPYSSLSLPDIPGVYSSLSSNTSSISSPSASPRTVSPVPEARTSEAKPEQNTPDLVAPFTAQNKRKAPGFDRPLLTSEEYQKMKMQAFQEHLENREPEREDHQDQAPTSQRRTSFLTNLSPQTSACYIFLRAGKRGRCVCVPGCPYHPVPGTCKPGTDMFLEDTQPRKCLTSQQFQVPPKASDIRNPNSIWSGYGFSQSSPSYTQKEKRPSDEEKLPKVDEDIWYNNDICQPDQTASSYTTDTLSASNYLDSASSSTLSAMSNLNFKDLQTLLAVLGLEKYLPLFESNEIDIGTFRTLTDTDLKEIGVTAFGARRKILLCVAEMNRRERSPFRGSAAPGAERKSSSTNSLDDNW